MCQKYVSEEEIFIQTNRMIFSTVEYPVYFYTVFKVFIQYIIYSIYIKYIAYNNNIKK